MAESGWAPRGIDINTPNVARMYDYYLGGKDNYQADRAAAEQMLEMAPFTPALARQNRRFLTRAVRYLARSGITQFLDIGTGLPTQGNVHEAAREVEPRAGVAYVDNDPVVVTHGRALLGMDTRTLVAEHDLRRPAEILADPQISGLIDFTRPVGLLLVSVLHCLSEADRPYQAVAELRAALAPGSHLVISHITGDDEITQVAKKIYSNASTGMSHRSREEILGFFDGFELLEPGLVRLNEWRPDGPVGLGESRGEGYYYCGVGRLPEAD